MPSSPLARRHVLSLVLAAACWGIGTAVSKQAVAEIPPLTLLAAQLAVSLLFLAPVARRRGERMPPGRDGRRLARLGLLNPGLAYALSLLGRIRPDTRLPLVPVSPSTEALIRRAMVHAGLLNA